MNNYDGLILSRSLCLIEFSSQINCRIKILTKLEEYLHSVSNNCLQCSVCITIYSSVNKNNEDSIIVVNDCIRLLEVLINICLMATTVAVFLTIVIILILYHLTVISFLICLLTISYTSLKYFYSYILFFFLLIF